MRVISGKKIVNMVCDKCVGILYGFSNEIQLKHEDGCPNKWREDQFLLSLAEASSSAVFGKKCYPKVFKAKLNPDIHQRFWDGEITQKQARHENKALQLQNSKISY